MLAQESKPASQRLKNVKVIKSSSAMSPFFGVVGAEEKMVKEKTGQRAQEIAKQEKKQDDSKEDLQETKKQDQKEKEDSSTDEKS